MGVLTDQQAASVNLTDRLIAFWKRLKAIKSDDNLSKDLSAILTLLFLVITYHILHPTMLFRVQFGETFRDANEEGFQEAMVIALIFSAALLVGSFRQLWHDRHNGRGRLRIALIIGGLGLYSLHAFAAIHRDYNVFLKMFGIDPEIFVDTLRMRRSEAEIFAPPITALNTFALLGGAGLASIIYLWSPWDYRDAVKRDELPLFWSRCAVGVSAIALWLMTYHAVHPIWRNGIGQSLSNYGTFLGFGLVITVILLIDSPFQLMKGWKNREGRLRITILIGISLYILHVLVVSIFDYDVIADYHDFQSSAMDDLLLNPDFIQPLKVTDRSSLLAGVAFISIFYLWMPWERLSLYFTAIRDNLSAIIVAILAVFAWQQAIDIFKIEQFLLPKPTVIWDTFKETYPSVIAGAWYTVKNAIQGFMFGCGAGILTGAISARFVRFSKAILPIAVAANAVPIIAFAPIANASFSFTSPTSKVVIVMLLCYFPTMISTVQGLTSVEARQLELMRSYAASELQIFRYVRIPNALPFIFSALKLAATLAMIGAIVAEFFGGSPFTSLGFGIKNDAALLKMTESWSRIIVASVLGIGFYLLVSVLEFNAMPWHGSFRSDSRS